MNKEKFLKAMELHGKIEELKTHLDFLEAGALYNIAVTNTVSNVVISLYPSDECLERIFSFIVEDFEGRLKRLKAQFEAL